MLFTIIVPIYNVENYLDECLDSLLAQTFTDFEVILVNDGSTDDSLKHAQNYVDKNPHFKLITQPNAGLSAARNTGIKHARGDYLLFVDSDDKIAPSTLSVLAQTLTTYDSPDIVRFAYTAYDSQTGDVLPDQITKISQAQDNVVYPAHAYYLLWRMAPPMACMNLCRRTMIEKNQLLFYEGIYHEDNEWTPRLILSAQRIVQIPDVLYLYRIRANSIMRNLTQKHIKDICICTENLLTYSWHLPLPLQRYFRNDAVRNGLYYYWRAHANVQSNVDLLPLQNILKKQKIADAAALNVKIYLFLFKISPKLYCQIQSLRLKCAKQKG